MQTYLVGPQPKYSWSDSAGRRRNRAAARRKGQRAAEQVEKDTAAIVAPDSPGIADYEIAAQKHSAGSNTADFNPPETVVPS